MALQPLLLIRRTLIKGNPPGLISAPGSGANMLRTAAPSFDLNAFLEEICISLQLTPAQYEEAVGHYEAIGAWLAEPGSPLARMRPEIFPQGSMRLQTTVRPRAHEEFDLDLVCQLSTTEPDAMKLFEMVATRIEGHATYRGMSTRLNRCIRLDYAGRFHLDILPAKPDLAATANCLSVPDRSLVDWKPSNPKDFATWFEGRTRLARVEKLAGVAPMQTQEPAEHKPALSRAVQLIKRYRDNYFGDDTENAPRSIVLTTLAGRHYRGEDQILPSLQTIVAGMTAEVQSTVGILKVLNPTNEKENFAEAWDLTSYDAFRKFLTDTAREFGELGSMRGMHLLAERGNRLFGDKVTEAALGAIEKRLTGARAAGTLKVISSTGLSTATGRPVQRNTFFGS